MNRIRRLAIDLLRCRARLLARHLPGLFPAFPGIVLVGFLFVAGCDSAERPRPTLGIVLAASLIDGARLAIADAAVDGELSFDTVFVLERSNRPAPAIEAANRLAAIPGLIGVVGHSNSAASLAASPIYHAAEVVQFAPTSSAVVYGEAGPFSFRLVPPDDRQGAFIAEAVDSLFEAGTTLGLFYTNDDYGRGLRRAFLDRVDTARNPVVVDLPHEEDDGVEDAIPSVRDAVEELRPQVILFFSRGIPLHRFLPHFREILGPVPILGGDALATWSIHSNEDERWTGIRYVEFFDAFGTQRLRDFQQRLQEEYGYHSNGPEILSYDATRMMIEGVLAGARTAEELREFLLSFGRSRPAFQGISGPIRFTESGEVESAYHLAEVGERP